MKVKELLAKPESWTQRVSARSADGIVAPVRSNKAAKWCLHGAVVKCYPPYSPYLPVDPGACPTQHAIVLNMLNTATGKLGFSNVVKYNDAKDRTHAEVLALVTELDI